MNAANVATIVVAVIAAAASIAAAISARRSADSIDRRRHLVEALDDERSSFLTAFGNFSSAGAEAAKSRDAGPLLFASESLHIHPRSTDALRTGVAIVGNAVTQALHGGTAVHGINDAMSTVRTEAREILVQIATERADAIRRL